MKLLKCSIKSGSFERFIIRNWQYSWYKDVHKTNWHEIKKKGYSRPIPGGYLKMLLKFPFTPLDMNCRRNKWAHREKVNRVAAAFSITSFCGSSAEFLLVTIFRVHGFLSYFMRGQVDATRISECDRDLKKTTTATATRTWLNKRSNE